MFLNTMNEQLKYNGDCSLFSVFPRSSIPNKIRAYSSCIQVTTELLCTFPLLKPNQKELHNSTVNLNFHNKQYHLHLKQKAN